MAANSLPAAPAPAFPTDCPDCGKGRTWIGEGVPLCTNSELPCPQAPIPGRTFSVGPAIAPSAAALPALPDSSADQLVSAPMPTGYPLGARAWQQRRLEQLGRELLVTLGEDPTRAGIEETPRRWASWWMEFVHHDEGTTDTTFEAVHADQMVVVRGVRVWSLCEHHLLPFWCDLTMAYLAHDKVLGLSKFARIASRYAHRLQLQERLVAQVADHLVRVTESPDVAVLAEGEHLCMVARGAKAPHRMHSSVLRGAFRDNPAARQEMLMLAGGSTRGA